MADDTQAIDREVAESYETGFAPKHEPTRKRSRGGKRNQSAGSEKVTVQGATTKPTNAKAKAVPKVVAKDIQDLATGALSVYGFVAPQPKAIDGQPIWPLDKSDAMDMANLKQLGESGAALLNRLPDWLRKYVVTGVKGGAIGVELTQFYEALVGLVMSRLMLVAMAAQDQAQAKAGGPGPAYRDNAQDPIPSAEDMMAWASRGPGDGN